MITLAQKANATMKNFERDSAIIFNEAELNDYLNLVAIELKKDLNLNDETRFLDVETIEQEIYFYMDETTGARVYDAELMLQEFQNKLNQLTKGTI
jgi:hypothetical protein